MDGRQVEVLKFAREQMTNQNREECSKRQFGFRKSYREKEATKKNRKSIDKDITYILVPRGFQ